ncbi:17974_t:CDS:2 [Funneliformis geosporum]|nr:17974_t:CDS:2 [Funneliformis geosporum]
MNIEFIWKGTFLSHLEFRNAPRELETATIVDSVKYYNRLPVFTYKY